MIAVRGRHVGITLLCTAQYINTVPAVIRSNCVSHSKNYTIKKIEQ